MLRVMLRLGLGLLWLGCGDAEVASVESKTGAPEAAEAVATPGAGAATVFREHRVTDPGMNGRVASSLLIPEGWTVEGGMTRPANAYYSNPVIVDLTVQAPDGRTVRFFPSLSFEFGGQAAELLSPTLGGYFYFPLPESPGAWFLQMAQLSPVPGVTGLTLVSETSEETLTQQLRTQNAATYRMLEEQRPLAMQTGVGSEFDTQATVLVIRYEENGTPFEETILLAWQYFVNSYQGRVTGGSWGIPQMVSMRGAPGSGYTDDPILLAILQSARVDPGWQAEMNRYWAELARIKHQGNMERQRQSAAAHQKRMQTYGEISDIITGGYRTRSAMRDAGHAAAVDTIREVTPYTTPTGETVKLPSFYEQVYTDGNGRYLLHDDSLYDPNTDPAVNQSDWQRIEAQR